MDSDEFENKNITTATMTNGGTNVWRQTKNNNNDQSQQQSPKNEIQSQPSNFTTIAKLDTIHEQLDVQLYLSCLNPLILIFHLII